MSNTLSIFDYSDIFSRRTSLLGYHVFDDFFNAFIDDWVRLQNKTVQGYPVCDIYRNEEASTMLEFALAGFQKEDLTIAVRPEKRSITVSAKSEDTGKTNRRIAKRSFVKTYINYDDNLDLAASVAKFVDGLLTVTIPVRLVVQPLAFSIL